VSGSDVVLKLSGGDSMKAMAKAVSVLGGDGCKELFVKKPTLEDVFLNLTGERLE
jgi:ABC-2 type transport system ATP-binding protein